VLRHYPPAILMEDFCQDLPKPLRRFRQTLRPPSCQPPPGFKPQDYSGVEKQPQGCPTVMLLTKFLQETRNPFHAPPSSFLPSSVNGPTRVTERTRLAGEMKLLLHDIRSSRGHEGPTGRCSVPEASQSKGIRGPHGLIETVHIRQCQYSRTSIPHKFQTLLN
jgi:hypothetical protein